jgi:acetoin utilization deacetylase AcuC-like enzyme
VTVAAPLVVLEDDRYRDHVGPRDHPERPARLGAVAEAIAAHPACPRLTARPAEDDELLRVHTADHLRILREAAQRAPTRLDADTYCGPHSESVARLAAGGLVEVVRAVARGDAIRGLAAVRPPGHHAEADRAMGFCLLNNAAIAARAIQAEAGAERVLVIDWDVHHGNGTQHVFEEDPSVLYFSTHQFPYYPGTGAAGEAGRGRGLGATLNVPMPAGCGDAEYVGVFQRVLAPAARAFGPDLILVSCGFDAHRDDPLASMDVSGAGYLALAHLVRGLADELCAGRLVFALEGGYALTGLAEGTSAILTACLADRAAPVPAPDAPAGSLLRHVLTPVVAVHGHRIRHLGAL